MELFIMPRQTEGVRNDADGDRVLNGTAWLTHNRHVRNGRRKIAGCAMCEQGLDGAYSAIKGPEPEPDVVQDTGADKEGANPLSRDRLGDAEYERLLQIYDVGEV